MDAQSFFRFERDFNGLAFSTMGVFRSLKRWEEKITSDTVAYCNTVGLFMVNIVLP